MKRVAHVLRKYDPAEWGGTETHVTEVAKRQADFGWQPEVHAPYGPSAQDRALPHSVPLRRYHAFLPFLGSGQTRQALIANAGNIASFHEPIRLLAERDFALAHLHTSGRIGGAVRSAMRWTNRPYIVSVHGPMLANQDWLAEETKKRTGRAIDLGRPIGAFFGARRVLDDAARVISFNKEERDAIAARIGERAIRMDHGVDPSRMKKGNAERARQRWPFLKNAPIVALVGRVSTQKNQLLAVQAFAKAAPPEFRLIFAGAQTDPGYQDRVETEARALGIAERVHFLGNLAPNEVPDVFAVADLIVVPSTHEAFGLIVLEGWAAHKPVIFARHSGLTDIAQALEHDEDRAVVRSLDLEAWTTKLRDTLRDRAGMQALADSGYALIEKRFSWDRVVKDLTELYEAVLEEHRVC